MPRLRIATLLLSAFVLASPPCHPQTATTSPSVIPSNPTTPATSTTPPAAPKPLPQSAEQSGGPEILVPASDNTFPYTVSLSTQNQPVVSEIRAGQLTNPEHPNLQIVPTLTPETPIKTATGWSVPIKLTGLIPFGSSTLPVYYESKKIDTIHILKNGITVEAPTAPQNQGDPLLLVLRNPTDLHYTSVRARLRFQGKDICTFSVEKFFHPASVAPQSQTGAQNPPKQASMPSQTTVTDTKALDSCNEVAGWTGFEIPGYSGVSLRTSSLPSQWFNAPPGYSLAVAQKGTLTLRFTVDENNPQSLQEQILPIEMNFQPGTISRSLGYVRVGCWLLLGALFSLVLRVAIPNYRRLRSIRDQLSEIRKTTRGISEEVDSMLRVQLRVENLSLGTLAGSVLVISPGFAELATRVEAAMTTLRRRLDYVRRLDAALSRRRLLIADELAQPTRIAAIDRSLNTASEQLKSDQFREQDWVFIQQALEAADKILGNPSEEDKSTFETVLVQRWQSISRQYGFTPDQGWTAIPPSLHAMTVCFPEVEALCPKGTISTGQADPAQARQADAIQWIKAVGTVRADLQITALELIREFQFLAPAVITAPPPLASPDATILDWQKAMNTLIPWLATPAFENLNNARLLLRELAEGIRPEHIVRALRNKEAHIELDPQVVGSGERVHLAIRFWRLDWNSAAARQQIVCEWRFKAVEGKRQSGTPEVEPKPSDALNHTATPAEKAARTANETVYYREKGWEVYHYFEERALRAPLEVRFYSQGQLVKEAEGSKDDLVYHYVFDLRSSNKSQAYWEQSRRIIFESLELFAALLVPLCALAVSTADKGSSSQWWQLLGLGFGSDTIRNVLSSAPDSKASKQN